MRPRRYPYLALAVRTLDAWRARVPGLGPLRCSLAGGAASRSRLTPEDLLPWHLRAGGEAAGASSELLAIAEAREAVRFAGAAGPRRALRRDLAEAYCRVTDAVEGLHSWADMAAFARRVLALKGVPGCLVEAGAYKGGGTAKLSLLARAVRRPLFVFDTFRGLPQELRDRSIDGRRMEKPQGAYRGSLSEVRSAVRRYGWKRGCRFVPGLLQETLGGLDFPVAAAYVDVDLALSVGHCIEALYPRLSPGGFIFSHDGRFEAVVRLLSDRGFWKERVGGGRPRLYGLGRGKLIVIVKPLPARPRGKRKGRR